MTDVQPNALRLSQIGRPMSDVEKMSVEELRTIVAQNPDATADQDNALGELARRASLYEELRDAVDWTRTQTIYMEASARESRADTILRAYRARPASKSQSPPPILSDSSGGTTGSGDEKTS